MVREAERGRVVREARRSGRALAARCGWQRCGGTRRRGGLSRGTVGRSWLLVGPDDGLAGTGAEQVSSHGRESPAGMAGVLTEG